MAGHEALTLRLSGQDACKHASGIPGFGSAEEIEKQSMRDVAHPGYGMQQESPPTLPSHNGTERCCLSSLQSSAQVLEHLFQSQIRREA